MPTVVNDLILEPKAEPPGASAGASAKPSGGGDGTGTAPSPDLERQVRQIERVCHERGLRLWAH